MFYLAGLLDGFRFATQKAIVNAKTKAMNPLAKWEISTGQ